MSLLRARSHDLSSAPAKRTPVQSHFVSLLRARSCDHSSVPSGRTPVHRHLRYNFLSPLRASHESHATSSTATAHCLCHHRSFSAPTASRSLPAALNPLAAMSTYLRHRPLLRAPARFPAFFRRTSDAFYLTSRRKWQTHLWGWYPAQCDSAAVYARYIYIINTGVNVLRA